MAVLFSDDFNTGTEPNATNWTEAGDWDLVGAAARAIDALNPNVLLTTVTAHAATTDVKVTVTQKSATGDGGPVARWSGVGATSTGYALDSYPNVLELYRHNGSATGTLLATGIANTTAVNGVLALEVSGTGATVTVKSYLGGVLKQTVSDTNASRITSAGRTGIYSWTAGVGVATADYDDFQVESLAAGGIGMSWMPRTEYEQPWGGPDFIPTGMSWPR